MPIPIVGNAARPVRDGSSGNSIRVDQRCAVTQDLAARPERPDPIDWRNRISNSYRLKFSRPLIVRSLVLLAVAKLGEAEPLRPRHPDRPLEPLRVRAAHRQPGAQRDFSVQVRRDERPSHSQRPAAALAVGVSGPSSVGLSPDLGHRLLLG